MRGGGPVRAAIAPGEGQLHGHPGLHVHGAAAVEHVPLPGRGHGAAGAGHGGQGHRVQVAGEDHAGVPAEVGAGHHGVPEAPHLEPTQGAQRGLHRVGERTLVPRDGRDVQQDGGELRDVEAGSGEVGQGRGGGLGHASSLRTRSVFPRAASGPVVILGRMTETAAQHPSARLVSGHGLATTAADGTVLDVWFPAPVAGPLADADAALAETLRSLAADDADRGTTQSVVELEADLDAAPATAEDAWLRLHALSHRLVRPNELNLDGVFGLLANVVWTNFGPCAVEGFELTRARLRARGAVNVYGVDKFPRMTDYVVPTGVRIGDADRVRLGAHLAEGTTVMHEGFVNFNAGTLGHSMVEGRISAGVVVGDGSDLGGGVSIMGTLSGGGTQKVVIGEHVLLGANSGVGISIGDDCVVEAGLYVTAGTLVTVVRPGEESRTVKAVELSGVPNLLFRRNSATGVVEVLPRAGRTVELNAALHAN